MQGELSKEQAFQTLLVTSLWEQPYSFWLVQLLSPERAKICQLMCHCDLNAEEVIFELDS